MARLYRDVVLLECTDAAALADAMGSLPHRLIVWRISETVVALDPEAYEEIVALLTRAGLSPRTVTV